MDNATRFSSTRTLDNPTYFHGGADPWSAADALVGLFAVRKTDLMAKERVQGDPRGPGGPPHNFTFDQTIGWENEWH